MDFLLEQPLLLAAVSAIMAVLLTWMVMRRPPQAAAPKREEGLDTVQAWPPQAVRVMTLGERQARPRVYPVPGDLFKTVPLFLRALAGSRAKSR